MLKLVFFKVIILTLLKCIPVFSTTRPIIGVMSQHFNDAYHVGGPEHPKSSFIPASYVKAVESAGARVVPILVDRSYDYYQHILHSINGVVIPGSDNEIQLGTPYYDTLVTIVKIAEQMNDKGIYFPIMGMCWGLEALLALYNNHTTLLRDCDAQRMNYPLHFEPKFTESLLFSQIDAESYYRLKHFPITAHAHTLCVTPQNFTKTDLPKYWKITSTCVSSRGIKFIASAEHKKYPFIGLQFHPERSPFEWHEALRLHHNMAAVKANRHFNDVFVRLARLNNNKFQTVEEERKTLIYNYQPFYPPHSESYSLVYVFD